MGRLYNRQHKKEKGAFFMDAGNRLFTFKLYELERRYEQLQSSILFYQRADHKAIRIELSHIQDSCQEDERRLQESIESCRSPAVAALSGVQKEYIKKAKNVLERYIGRYQSGIPSEDQENRAEAIALYAEYAIDFAAQAINHAQLAALSAIDLQITAEEAASRE